jgi:hypothetical protein
MIIIDDFRAPDATARGTANTVANPDDGAVICHDQTQLRIGMCRFRRRAPNRWLPSMALCHDDR